MNAPRDWSAWNKLRMPDAQWSQSLVTRFPNSWAEVLVRKWRGEHRDGAAAANLRHLLTCKAIERGMQTGVNADANDGEIVSVAATSARDAERRLQHVQAMADRTLADRSPEQRERLSMLGKVAAMIPWLESQGLAGDFLRQCARGIVGALRRLVDERWWRRVLRVAHARAFEATARAMGQVHKRAGCYVSGDSLRRRRGQLVRNERALEGVKAINEHGQEYTLAELAAKSVSNREIRRHELMTRIAGFELIAKDCGHEAYFVTVTCPSRMHAFRTRRKGFGVEENKRWDGTTPDEAQRYLSKQWNAFGSAAARWGLELYGFRIAEPNHDGTPHWHALLFMPREVGRGLVKNNPRAGRAVAGRVMVRLLRRYFLHNADGGERGARAHRVVVEKIDWNRGSAAGYVAKYVAKNIDGYRVEKDLYGNDALTSSQRVDAWASTWRVRQFQQIGGAPVTVWRELRRLHPEQADACAAVGFGLDAVNVAKQADPDASEALERHTAATGWAGYLHLQGGHRVTRARQRLHVLRETTGELGRYGEVLAPRAVGVVTVDVEAGRVVPAFGIIPERRMPSRRVRVEVESERCSSWTLIDGVRERMADGEWQDKPGAASRLEVARARALAGGEAARPWSPVNNSTPPENPYALLRRVRKVGRAFNWAGGPSPKDRNDPRDPRKHPGA